MQKQTKTILAAVGDLFSTIKITEAAKRAGLEVEFVKTEKDLLEKAKFKPVLIIFDLNFSAMQPLKAVAKLKSSAELKSISLIGYLTHAQGELKQKAHEAGCNMVLARSAFSQNLPQILKRFADAP
jgi:PleD family two-component response regulator